MDRRGYGIRTLAGPISETFTKRLNKELPIQNITDTSGYFQAYVTNALMLPSPKPKESTFKEAREAFLLLFLVQLSDHFFHLPWLLFLLCLLSLTSSVFFPIQNLQETDLVKPVKILNLNFKIKMGQKR